MQWARSRSAIDPQRNTYKHFLPLKHVQTLYHTLVEPYLNYCCLVWAGMEKTVILERIHKLQKKILSNNNFFLLYSAFSSAFQKSGYFDNNIILYSIYKLQLSLYMFKQMKNLLPGANPFNFNKLSHTYDTRHKSVPHMNHCRTKLRQSTVQFQGPKLWNSLPQHISIE